MGILGICCGNVHFKQIKYGIRSNDKYLRDASILSNHIRNISHKILICQDIVFKICKINENYNIFGNKRGGLKPNHKIPLTILPIIFYLGSSILWLWKQALNPCPLGNKTAVRTAFTAFEPFTALHLQDTDTF